MSISVKLDIAQFYSRVNGLNRTVGTVFVNKNYDVYIAHNNHVAFIFNHLHLRLIICGSILKEGLVRFHIFFLILRALLVVESKVTKHVFITVVKV